MTPDTSTQAVEAMANICKENAERYGYRSDQWFAVEKLLRALAAERNELLYSWETSPIVRNFVKEMRRKARAAAMEETAKHFDAMATNYADEVAQNIRALAEKEGK